MTEGLRAEKGIYRLANAGLLAGVALFGGGRFLGIGDLTVWLALGAAVILALLAGINFLPLRGKLFCLSVAVLGVGMAVSVAGVRESLLFLRHYFSWLVAGTGEEYGQWAGGYALLQTAIIAALCYFIQILLEKVSGIKPFFAVSLLVGMLLCLFWQKEIPRLGMAFGLCYIVTVYAEWAEGRWKKVRGASRRAYMLRIMPFLAVYLLLLGCMPAPQSPFEWRLVKNIYLQLRETLVEYTQMVKWGGREGFGMSFCGFSDSEEARTGGGLQESSEAVMTVQVLGDEPVNVYLTGTVYDAFDGRQWRQVYRGEPWGALLDTAETLCAVREYGGQYQMDYIHRVKLRISYQDFHTGYLFAPLKTREIRSEGEELAYACEGGSLCLEEYRGYGTAYELQYYQMNGGQEEFYRFLETCSDWSTASEEETCPTDRAIWEELGRPGAVDVASYRRQISENYLQEVELSEDVADYLMKITQGAQSDVDKLRAIERELSSYIYTKSPGELPGWVKGPREFLDYFLLESRQGYCTYFATAFVLLARAEGIPARYVQGFCVPAQDAGEVLVYSNMAHAWPEVYISGAGWIPFEPTPGYGGIRFASWELRRPQDSVGDETGGEIELAESAQPYQEEDVKAEEPQDCEAAQERERTRRFLRALGYLIPGLLAGYLLFLLLDKAWSRRRYQRMSLEERFELTVSRNLKLLALLGLKRAESETLQELQVRCRPLTEHGVDGSAAHSLCFIDHYESVVYGGRSVSVEMIGEAVEETQMLLELLKQEKRWTYARWRVRIWLNPYR